MLLLASLAAKEPVVAEHDAALGAQAEAIARIVQQQFAGEIRRVMVAIVAAAACIGSCSAAPPRARPCSRRDARALWRAAVRWRLARALAIASALEAWFLFEAMARRPQLYADRFYAHGGIGGTTQVLVTDVFGPFPSRPSAPRSSSPTVWAFRARGLAIESCCGKRLVAGRTRSASSRRSFRCTQRRQRRRQRRRQHQRQRQETAPWRCARLGR